MFDNDKTAYDILRSIRRILRKVSQHSRHLSRETGFTVPQLLCMQAIEELTLTGEPTVGAISDRVRLSPATVSRILDRLERSGCAARERRSKDRRKVTMALPPEGRRRMDSLPRPLHDQFLERLGALSGGQQIELLTSLTQIVDMMEASELDALPVLSIHDESE